MKFPIYPPPRVWSSWMMIWPTSKCWPKMPEHWPVRLFTRPSDCIRYLS